MKKKILIVDDEVELVDLLKQSLEEHGYDVSCAYDGKKAIETFFSVEPDLLLIDIRMPKFDGNQVIMTLKSTPKAKSVPIIIISAYCDEQQIEYAKRLGVDAYFPKPFLADEVYQKINALLDRKEDAHA